MGSRSWQGKKSTRKQESESQPLPTEVTEVLENSEIGYLTTISKKGDLYSYPVAFYYSNAKVYFVTPVSAAKYKMIKENPTVSLIVDNKKLTTNATGAMIQGKARTFSVTRTILSILSLGPKVAAFSKKYPGMLTFYAKGKELPDERKLYKYRIIQINPTKILYWIGYNFGRYVPARNLKLGGRFGIGKNEHDAAELSRLFVSADENQVPSQGPVDHDWLVKLEAAASNGRVNDEERAIISRYKTSEIDSASKITAEEKRLLNKWKTNK